MTTPSFPSITTRHVTGTWLPLAAGMPLAGTVTFEPSVPCLVDHTDKQIAVGSFVIELNSEGEIDVPIPVTDDTDFLPTGWYYTVTIATQDRYDNSTKQVTTFTMELPTDSNPLDLSTVVPLDTIPALAIKPWANITNYDPNATNHWNATTTDGHMTFPALSVRQQTEDVFQLRGLIAITGTTGVEEVAFALPTGYAPSSPAYICGVTPTGLSVPFRVEPNGEVVSTMGWTTSTVSLDGCYYLK